MEKMKKLWIAILTMTLLTLSIGMATAVPMIYDISYDPITKETYITNNATSQSSLELYGAYNGDIVSQVWLAPGDSITFYEDGTHSPCTNGTKKLKHQNLNSSNKAITVTGTFEYRRMATNGKWGDWAKKDTTMGAEPLKIRKGTKNCTFQVRGEKSKFTVTGCLVKPILDETDIIVEPIEHPWYLPADQYVIKLLSGGLRVETDTDEFITVITPSEEHAGCKVPEFSTIAIPVATILGLLFLFSCKKRKP